MRERTLWLWLALALPLAAVASGRTVVVGPASGLSLRDALADQGVTTIRLEGNVTAGGTLPAGAPLLLTRNVTITGGDGGRGGGDAPGTPVLDLGFASSVVRLCGSCALMLQHLVVANDRRGSGMAYDFASGAPGSRLLSVNVTHLRLACTPAGAAAAAAAAAPRSRLLPNPGGAQRLHVADVTVQGRAFPESLVYGDVTLDVPAAHEEGRGDTGGGYALGLSGDVRVCQHIVSQACLDTKSADACVNSVIDKAVDSSQGGPATATGLPVGVLAACVAVPVVLVLVASAAVLLWLRSKRTRSAGALPGACAGSGSLGATSSGSGGGRHSSLKLGSLVLGRDWQLVSSLTSPALGDVPDNEIVLGDLLGSGSFGRVFAGRWAGRDCAVKVIEHGADILSAVEQEVQLMLKFDHPHIVRAWHSCTYTAAGGGMGSCVSTSSGSHALLQIGVSASGAGGDAGSSHNVSVTGSTSQQAQSALQPAGSTSIDGLPAWEQDQLNAAAAAVPGSSRAGSHQAMASCCDDSATTWQLRGPSLKSGAHKGMPKRAMTWLVLEYCDGGSLSRFMAGAGGVQHERNMLLLLRLLHDTAEGLAQLHAKSVVHGDLNAHNVLVSSCPSEPCQVVAKVSDLGLSRVVEQNKTHMTTNTVGTLSHMPPELLRYGRMSPACDIYAFGIMMWELYTGHHAFKGLQNPGQIFETVVLRGLRPVLPPGMPADLSLLMQHCWATEPDDRPSVERVQEVLAYMINSREAAARADSRGNFMARTSSAPLPALLLKPLPERPAWHAQRSFVTGRHARARAERYCDNDDDDTRGRDSDGDEGGDAGTVPQPGAAATAATPPGVPFLDQVDELDELPGGRPLHAAVADSTVVVQQPRPPRRGWFSRRSMERRVSTDRLPRFNRISMDSTTDAAARELAAQGVREPSWLQGFRPDSITSRQNSWFQTLREASVTRVREPWFV